MKRTERAYKLKQEEKKKEFWIVLGAFVGIIVVIALLYKTSNDKELVNEQKSTNPSIYIADTVNVDDDYITLKSMKIVGSDEGQVIVEALITMRSPNDSGTLITTSDFTMQVGDEVIKPYQITGRDWDEFSAFLEDKVIKKKIQFKLPSVPTTSYLVYKRLPESKVPDGTWTIYGEDLKEMYY